MQKSLLHAKKFGNFPLKLLNHFTFTIRVVDNIVAFAPFRHRGKSLGRRGLEMTSQRPRATLAQFVYFTVFQRRSSEILLIDSL